MGQRPSRGLRQDAHHFAATMPKHWRIHPHDPTRIAHLTRAARVPSVVAQLLICRGITDPAAVATFLDPRLSALRDPELLPGCPEAAEVLHRAVREKRRIVIYGDYDVDGVTATAILWQCLRLLGGNVGYYVPHRLDEGYGLNHQAIRTLSSQGAELLVTVDCGINSLAEAATASECRMQLVVTDHHEPGAVLPAAEAVVHPRLPGSSYPFGQLSGSGVALKVAWALCRRAAGTRRVSEPMRELLLRATALAALGTVADVVPLIDENRVLVRHGLAALAETPPLGLAALLRIAQLDGRRPIASEDVAFAVGPRLNAAGRLGQAPLAVELLTTGQAERAEELARYIDGLNGNRQTLERSIQLAAVKQAKERFDPEGDAALVLADRGWHAGVIGIVAGRLAERWHRPVVLVSWDQLGVRPGIGSARSIAGFNLHAALAECSDHLVSYGGHAAAAGLRIEEARLEAFREEFCRYAADRLDDADREAEILIDAEAPLSAFTLPVLGQIEKLAPFGAGNARPLFCASGVHLAQPPRTMGGGDRHLALRLSQHGTTLRAVAFGGGEWFEPIAACQGPLDVAFRPVLNTFRGQRNVELHLVDWRPALCR